MRLKALFGCGVVAAGAVLAACSKPEPRAKTPDELACADPLAKSRVNMRIAEDRGNADRVPGADILPDPNGFPLVVRRKIAVSGRTIEKVDVTTTGNGRADLRLHLNEDGRKALFEATRSIGENQLLAIVVDGRVTTAFGVNEPPDTAIVELHGGAYTRKTARAEAARVEAAARGCVPPPR